MFIHQMHVTWIILHAFKDVMKWQLHCPIDKRQSGKSTLIIIHSSSVSWIQIKPRAGLNWLVNGNYPYKRLSRITINVHISSVSDRVKKSLPVFPFSHPSPVCQVWLCWVQLPRPHLPRHGGSTNHTIEHQSGQHWDKGEVSFKRMGSLLITLSLNLVVKSVWWHFGLWSWRIQQNKTRQSN